MDAGVDAPYNIAPIMSIANPIFSMAYPEGVRHGALGLLVKVRPSQLAIAQMRMSGGRNFQEEGAVGRSVQLAPMGGAKRVINTLESNRKACTTLPLGDR